MSNYKRMLIFFHKLLVFVLVWFGVMVLMGYYFDSHARPGAEVGAMVMFLVVSSAGIGSHIIWLVLRLIADFSLIANIIGGFLTSLFILLSIGMYVKAWDVYMFTLVGIYSLVFLVPISLIEFAFKGVEKIVLMRSRA